MPHTCMYTSKPDMLEPAGSNLMLSGTGAHIPKQSIHDITDFQAAAPAPRPVASRKSRSLTASALGYGRTHADHYNYIGQSWAMPENKPISYVEMPPPTESQHARESTCRYENVGWARPSKRGPFSQPAPRPPPLPAGWPYNQQPQTARTPVPVEQAPERLPSQPLTDRPMTRQQERAPSPPRKVQFSQKRPGSAPVMSTMRAAYVDPRTVCNTKQAYGGPIPVQQAPVEWVGFANNSLARRGGAYNFQLYNSGLPQPARRPVSPRRLGSQQLRTKTEDFFY